MAAGKYCMRCGLRVYRVVTADGFHFWVTSSDNPTDEWGKAVCVGHR